MSGGFMEDEMSFRVNTNVSAMNALRNLGFNSTEFSKSITRLSTGLRINSAADDPAGLIVSESMRAQMSGLDQAMRNSQDAINYAKTAEGALDEVSRLLRDARSLAVAAANTGTLSNSQIQANQSQLQSISESISRIANNTQFGTKKLLDGSSGVTSAVTNANTLSSLNIGGQFGGAALSANGAVNMQVTQAATRGAVTSRTFATANTAVGAGNAGSFTLNGVTFTAGATTTANELVEMVNQKSGQTGVTARYDSVGQAIVFETSEWGSNARIDLTDSTGVVRSGGAGASTASGTNALATVTIGALTSLFTGSQNGNGGLTLSDANGNTLRLTTAGNAVAASAPVGQVRVGSASFQIGANAGQTTSLSLGNFASSQLGNGAVGGLNMSNLDVTSASGAQDALSVIDEAISQVTKARGSIGSFQRNVLESNIRSLGVTRENLAATESSIRDVDVAAEMTNYTKLQILQQAGMSVLAQANSAPQQVLALLR
jgi:flagellin